MPSEADGPPGTAAGDAPPPPSPVRPGGLTAPLLMLLSSLLFAIMGAGVKFALEHYGTAEVVMYRSIVGAVVIVVLARANGISLATPVPLMHMWRSVVGVTALGLWFFSIGGLPLGTAITLNYLSSIWMALFVVAGAILAGQSRGFDGRLVLIVAMGFAGVALVLRPTLEPQQWWHALAGLLSGILAALAYLQITALGRIGEPETRVVFYFSLGGTLGGALAAVLGDGFHAHSLGSMAGLLVIGVLATLAQLLMTRAYAIGQLLTNAALQYLGVAFSFALGVWLFDDPLTWAAVAGMVLIAAAGLAATLLRSRQVPVGATTDS